MSSDMSEDGEYVTLTFPEELLFFFKESRMKYKVCMALYGVWIF